MPDDPSSFVNYYKILAAMGHRPVRLYGDDLSDVRYERLVRRMQDVVTKAYRQGYHLFVSGMGRGADILFAQAVLGVRSEYVNVRLVCAVPYLGQANLWPEEERSKWLEILRQADDICVTNSGLHPGFVDLRRRLEHLREGKSPKGIGADFEYEFLSRRNRWMLDQADAVLAVWNGSPGSTAGAVRMAQERGIKVIVLNPETLKTTTYRPIPTIGTEGEPPTQP
jgi:uncharacterized phage-like protein YoqJ